MEYKYHFSISVEYLSKIRAQCVYFSKAVKIFKVMKM